MLQNLKVHNLTGRNISFDLIQILESVPHFAKTAPNTWEKSYYATISVSDRVSVEPYDFRTTSSTSPQELRRFAVEVSMDLLSIEASYLYRCSAVIEWNVKRQSMTVFLRPSSNGTRCVQLGRYYGNSNRKEAVNWLVLEETDGEALLLSQHALHTDSYWIAYPDRTSLEDAHVLLWEYSEFRQWLNSDFCRTIFSERETELLLDTVIRTCDGAPEEALHNKIFLLSREQVERLLPTAKERIAKPTVFAVFGGAYQDEGNCCWWILPYRGNHFEPPHPQAVLPDGEIYYHSRNVFHRDFCVRPAIRIRSEVLERLRTGFIPEHKAEQEFRIPLDGDSLYFLRLFLKDNCIDRASIDKELADDSHYELSAAALKHSHVVLSEALGEGDLVQLLRKYFRNYSDYDLVRLMKQNGIPFRPFHY